MNELVPVDEATFYSTIGGPLDVHPHIVSSKWPYRSEYRLHRIIGQPVVGVRQDFRTGKPAYWIVRRYLR